MADYRNGLWRIPEHMHSSIVEWIETARIPPRLMGSFLRALLTNDLMGTFAHADETNRHAVDQWVTFLYNDAPSECYGTLAKLEAWHERGGLQGKPTASTASDTSNAKPKIFAFVNSGAGTDMQMVLALAEDGACLAQHCSSSHTWAKHDIGATSDWKHDEYRKHYPDGYEVVWLDEPGESVELARAYLKNHQAREASVKA